MTADAKEGERGVHDEDGKNIEAGDVDDLTPKEQREVWSHVDRRLIATCGIMYCISLIDRLNLSAAAIAGMTEELKLIGYRYSILALLFFVTYVIFQPPTTVVLRMVGPRPFLSSVCFLWGIVMICHGFPTLWTTMIPLRLLLGALEAFFYPGCVYLISTWYTRYRLHRRYSFFYLIGTVSAGFGGILAYGLMQMDGVGGYGGWRWIFIMEGIITVLIAGVGYFTLVDFPDRAANKSWSFLSERQCSWVLRSIAADRDDAEIEPFSLKRWAGGGLDVAVWAYALIYFCLTATTYSIAYFLPIILRGMGYSVAASQLLVAPPQVFAGILMIITSWIGDRYQTKAPILISMGVLAIAGLAVMGYATDPAARYIGVFITAGAANANIPTALTYQANNIRGQWKRAFCSTTLVGFGGIGGIAGSLVFRSQDAPLYRPGVYATMAANALVILIVCALSVRFRWANKKADRGEKVIEGLEGFRYTI